MSFHTKLAGAFALLVLGALPAAARTGDASGPMPREEAETAVEPADPGSRAGTAGVPAPGQQNYWGFGFGYVFNRIPISLSTFNVPISDLWYSHIFGDPGEKTRVAGTLGFYGFQLLLPVPKASLDLYFGKPSEDIQFKGGVGGFYDVSVGGHGGVAADVGVVLKNRVDVSFMAVPLGTDSKRSYSEFMGLETKEEAAETRAAAHGHYVELPYYAVKVGLRF
ncbi:MAG TPA: hypothetical protein VJ385_10770 [Fibrobacteria bacterium]|nr:hypothetical protein [Fibrobacteria bacterium]